MNTTLHAAFTGIVLVACTAPPDPSDSLPELSMELSMLLADDELLAGISDRLAADPNAGVPLTSIAQLAASGYDTADLATLQIRAPLGLGERGAPLVTYLDEGDGHEVTELAYYRHGALVDLRAADDAPTDPVVIIERTDESLMAPESSVGGVPLVTYKQMRLRQIRILEDREAGPFNDPELYMVCDFPNGLDVRINLPNVDQEDQWYSRDKIIVYWYPSYGEVMVCGFFEEDGGSSVTLNLSYSYNGATLSFALPFKSDDDNMGHTIINYNDPNYSYYSTGEVNFQLYWP